MKGWLTIGILIYFFLTVAYQQSPNSSCQCIYPNIIVFWNIVNMLSKHLFILFSGIVFKRYAASWSLDIFSCWLLIIYELVMIIFFIWLYIAGAVNYDGYLNSQAFSLALSILIFINVCLMFLLSKSWKKRP